MVDNHSKQFTSPSLGDPGTNAPLPTSQTEASLLDRPVRFMPSDLSQNFPLPSLSGLGYFAAIRLTQRRFTSNGSPPNRLDKQTIYFPQAAHKSVNKLGKLVILMRQQPY